MRDPAQRSTASATPLYGGGGGLGYPGPSSSFHWFAGGGGGGGYNPGPASQLVVQVVDHLQHLHLMLVQVWVEMMIL